MTLTDQNQRTRKRLIGTLFAGNAIISTAYICIVTVSTLISVEITGSMELSGLPTTVGTLGVAGGAAVLSALSMRIGRRVSFAAGYALAAIGVVLAGFSITQNSFTLLLFAMLVIGFGQSVGQLARYAAGDLSDPEHRASAISLIVWASTIGAVVGPLLIGPTSGFASAAGFDELLGPITIGAVGFGLGALLMFAALRPDPLKFAILTEHAEPDEPRTPLTVLLAFPTVKLSLVAMMTSQIVMSLVLVMTPLYILANDGNLATVGWVVMAHSLGMFAISPVTGRLINRFGPRRLIGFASGALATAGLIVSTATTAQVPILVVGLFLLGAGWNFGFVAGSALLQEGLPILDRLKIQGFADSSTWISGAAAAAVSGLIGATTSFATLALTASVLALVPAAYLYRTQATHRR